MYCVSLGWRPWQITECIPFKKALNISNTIIACAISNLLLGNFVQNTVQIYQKYEYQSLSFFQQENILKQKQIYYCAVLSANKVLNGPSLLALLRELCILVNFHCSKTKFSLSHMHRLLDFNIIFKKVRFIETDILNSKISFCSLNN